MIRTRGARQVTTWVMGWTSRWAELIQGLPWLVFFMAPFVVDGKDNFFSNDKGGDRCQPECLVDHSSCALLMSLTSEVYITSSKYTHVHADHVVQQSDAAWPYSNSLKSSCPLVILTLILENLQALWLTIGRHVKRVRGLGEPWRSSVEGMTSGVRQSRKKKRTFHWDSYHMGLCT